MRILAIDDEPDIVMIVEISLAKWGYVVDGFTNLVAALKHSRQHTKICACFLQKPFHTGDVSVAVKRHLNEE